MLRLFVAIYPPPEVAREILARSEGLQLEGLRLVAPEHLHLTAQFIGDTPVADLECTRESIARSASGLGPLALRWTRLVSMPARHPHLIAAMFDRQPVLSELHRRLAIRLAKRRDRKERPFLAHMTAARFRAGVHHAVSINLEKAREFTCREIVLVRSILKPGGAEHEAVERFPLEG